MAKHKGESSKGKGKNMAEVSMHALCEHLPKNRLWLRPLLRLPFV